MSSNDSEKRPGLYWYNKVVAIIYITAGIAFVCYEYISNGNYEVLPLWAYQAFGVVLIIYAIFRFMRKH